MKQIMILEDDPALNQGLQYDLGAEGYLVRPAFNIAEGKKLFEIHSADLILLDVNLPDGDGFEFCRWVKDRKKEVPVLFVTARDLEQDAVQGYDLGADDYIIKPFSMVLLRKKIAAVFRRFGGAGQPDYDDGHLFVRLDEMEVLKDGEKVNLTPTEYRLLKVFLSSRRQLLTHEVLIENVWGVEGLFIDKHALAVNVNRMRSKLEGNGHVYIANVYGMGYQWAGERE
mgnify:CR=1 FL=1